jgi:transcriptional regulator with XRE-family HTH domain
MGEFGSELTRWMQARDTGVRALARRAGYTASYISQLRAGKRMPSPEAAADLDDALSAGGELAASAPAAARASGRPVTRSMTTWSRHWHTGQRI